ncbi:hypothetical protein AT1G49940 [Arabidopsis thaliana]|uniref:Uncharacterized protein n=1 Tax=Arabidopsis thaliana TaxID=3702 RepID=F4I3G0_ARATH|nr:uncharacterized protein AT1G49940 [Arabidopsis thaliana]AEE32494.1 hypothetical protein AT1G49940 [Arabidopsis thaliana]|eukprot:NP_175416.1 hypothetical protein AT1G49940 [Arabidopsis thaliana]
MIYQEEAFNGKPAKIARSHGRNFRSRSRRKPLGYCRVSETQVIEPDANKACKKLPNIKCIVEVLLKWLEGMKKKLFKAKSQVGIIFEAKKEDILDKDEDEGNDGYYMDVELHGHSKDSSIFRTRVFLKWMSETMDHFDTKQDQLFEQDISDVNFDARHNKYCEISWQEISGHGREETTRILSQVGDAYNQIWVVKPEEKMKLLKNTKGGKYFGWGRGQRWEIYECSVAWP